MGAKKKTWKEKLADSKGFPKVCPIDESKTKHWGSGTFVIPAPSEVDALMRQVPCGQVTTIDEIRKALARKHHTTIGCPLTTGIFAWIAAHAAAEDEAAGKSTVTPYWRSLKAKGELNPKYPGGIENLQKRLAAEGHAVTQKGKRFILEGFPAKLFTHHS